MLNALVNEDCLIGLVLERNPNKMERCVPRPCPVFAAALLATVEGLLNWGLILLAQMLPERSPGIPLG